ncbi:MAG: excinuclease ABC subunit UvrB [Candidatus Komeilibacteria bacterium]
MQEKKFVLKSKFKPRGDQPQAIAKLDNGLNKKVRDQILLGVTGSGKTFTMANIIAQQQRPTLIISHNKTLAAQLAAEFERFFPENAVHYFVSYYDYYQPEAYIPRTDTYIEKETQINEEIDRLRHASTQAVLSRRDVIIVASVSCIYNLGNPRDYQDLSFGLQINTEHDRQEVLRQLVKLQYERQDNGYRRGIFRVKGDVVDIFPTATLDYYWRIEFWGDKIDAINQCDALTGKVLTEQPLKEIEIFPAKHYLTTPEKLKSIIGDIKRDLAIRLRSLKAQGNELAAQRLAQRTQYDLEMIQSVGYCNGIENYSRYFDGRQAGQAPYTLMDYFPDDYLLFIDESHMTVPQIGAMYNGDRARKNTLIDFGFRLPSALDNRPLQFDEFVQKVNQVIYVSATPGPYEWKQCNVPVDTTGTGWRVDWQAVSHLAEQPDSRVAEQLLRPTGLLDPVVEIRPTKYQIDDLLAEIKKTIKEKQRVLVTTLTKRMAEDLAEYLQDLQIKVHYLHSEVDTLERLDVLYDLRSGQVDVVVGINLLREGLDLPEVSLVAILDADKEGFLRSETSLIQTMGRAARHVAGRVIMYADKKTGSMQRALAVVERRRKIQADYNKKNNIKPRGVQKELGTKRQVKAPSELTAATAEWNKMDSLARNQLLSEMKDKMEIAAANLDFETAAYLRDEIKRLSSKRRNNG